MVQSKFKIGDRVKAIEAVDGNLATLGKVGTVAIVSGMQIGVIFDEDVKGHSLDGKAKQGYGYNCNRGGESLELLNKKTTMQKVGIFMKKLVDKDTQTLVKAGLLSEGLEITPEGQQALNALNFEANKAGMVKLAEEKLAEEKENCKS